MLNDNEINVPVFRIGIPDVLVDHASPDQSKEKLGLQPDQIAEKIINKFKTKQRNYQRFTNRKTNITSSERKKCLEKKTKFL